MTDDELQEMLPLAAVGALTDEELNDVETALEDRPELRAELEGLRAITLTLAEAVAETPPPGLRASLLDIIGTTPQLAPERPETADAATAERPLAPVVPISAGHRRWWAIGAVAAAVVVLLVGFVVVSPFGDDGSGDQVAAVVDADDAVEIPMPGELPGLTIVHSAEEDAAVLLADEVPVPEGDRVYELWAIRNGTPERFATFRPDDDGRLNVYAAGLDPASAELWAITEEPAGGSDAPTSAILNTTPA
ncbi:MAG: anti-sigma factor [Ilumatobacteraceae bacterium]